MSFSKKIDEIYEKIKKLNPEEIKVYQYLYYVDVFWRWLEHIGVIDEVLVEGRIPVSAGEKGYVDLWLPANLACGEREFEIYFPTSEGIKYGWLVDSTTEYTLDPHYFIPNSGYVERWTFGRYWVKWWMLRFTYEAYSSGTITIRAAAKLTSHENMLRFLKYMEPLAKALGITIPLKRPKPMVVYSQVIAECPICRAKLLRKDDQIVRVGTWGQVPSHKCPILG